MKVILTNDKIEFDVPDTVAANDEQLAAMIAAQFPKYADVQIQRDTDGVKVTSVPGKLG